ncbi:ATP synthase epsilon chain [Phycisphaerae bacterium]|nr:ATP synthase epsilon chain [Phycisphaerae bacterium]
MATPIHCTVVTPNAISLEEKATYVSFEAWDGQVGVMPGTSPFLTRLGTGVLTVTSETGSIKQILTDGGFAQMQGDNLTLLADNTVDISSIDAKQAEALLLQANQKAVEPGATTPAARESIERAQRVAQAKVNAAGRRVGQRA